MTQTQAKKPRRIWRIVLVASLALNLLVVGVVAGVILRAGGGVGAPDHAPHRGLIYYREMPHAARHDIREAARAGFRDRAEQRRAQRSRVLSVLRADRFDADALRSIMRTGADAARDGQLAMVDTWISHLEEMSASDRISYAQRVEEAANRRRPPGPPRD